MWLPRASARSLLRLEVEGLGVLGRWRFWISGTRPRFRRAGGFAVFGSRAVGTFYLMIWGFPKIGDSNIAP